jgi:hypothetical protein
LQRSARNRAAARLLAPPSTVQREAELAGHTEIRTGFVPSGDGGTLIGKSVLTFSGGSPITLTGTIEEIAEWLDDHAHLRLGWSGADKLHISIKAAAPTNKAQAAKRKWFQLGVATAGAIVNAPGADMLAKNAVNRKTLYVLSISTTENAAVRKDKRAEVTGEDATSTQWSVPFGDDQQSVRRNQALITVPERERRLE